MAVGRADQKSEQPDLGIWFAIAGAGLTCLAVFLPRAESSGMFTEIQSNTLIQSGDGIVFLALAIAASALAYTGRAAPTERRAILILLAGLAIVGLAIYAGTGDRLQLTGANTEDLDLFDALEAQAGEQGEPGVGIWAAGVGGGLLANRRPHDSIDRAYRAMNGRAPIRSRLVESPG